MTALRAGAYVRVSTEEQTEGWSLDAQKHHCTTLIAQRGWELTRVYEEPGRSAKTDLRPSFQRMMSDAEHGRLDVIVVQKLDRFSRSLPDVVKNIARLKKASVGLVSVSETWVDTTTIQGEMMVYLFALLAQWDNENRARETVKGKLERARNGYWNGTLAFGYTTPRKLKAQLVRVSEQYEAGAIDAHTYEQTANEIERHLERYQHMTEGDAIPDPINARGVILAYTWYASGVYSDSEIAQMLNAENFRTTGTWGERLFESDTVSPMLQNRFYLGETKYKDTRYPGRHEALIPVSLFDKCQEKRGFRSSRNVNKKSTKRIYPLSRLALCARCGYPMRGQGSPEYRYYRDPKHSIKQCTQHQIRADAVEDALIQYLSQIKLPHDWRARILQQSLAAQSNKQAVERQKASLEKQLERAKTLYQMGDIEQEEYFNTRNEIRAKLAAIEPVRDPDLEHAAKLLENIGELFKSATLQELDSIFHALLRTVYLDGGTYGPVMAIEPQPFLKVLMDVSGVPSVPDWTHGNPNDLLKRLESNGNNQYTPQDTETRDVACTKNDDTMNADAGKNYVAQINVAPVGPD